MSLSRIEEIARSYVRLALALAKHDEGYVDLYFGPPELAKDAGTPSTVSIQDSAQRLLLELGQVGGESGISIAEDARVRWLSDQLRALSARVDILGGVTRGFDEESAALYGVIAPEFPDDYFVDVRARLDKLLPGASPLADRYGAFRARFGVPPNRVSAAMTEAIAIGR